MIEQAAEVLARLDAEGCPVEWMRKRLPDNAIRITNQQPPRECQVLGWVSDIAVCIWFLPVVVRWDGHRYWAGLPAQWIDLEAHRWVLTHWREIGPVEALHAGRRCIAILAGERP